jgi:hypothetical protein
MAASGSVIALRKSQAAAAAPQLRAAVELVLACAREADGPELGELLILIREAGIDPLEAAFATGVRRFDKSGEYLADGALSVTAWLKWRCKLSGGAAAERVEIGKQLEHLPKTEAAFARGSLGYQHVAVMARTAENLGAATVRSEEGSLVKAAQTMDRASLRRWRRTSSTASTPQAPLPKRTAPMSAAISTSASRSVASFASMGCSMPKVEQPCGLRWPG